MKKFLSLLTILFLVLFILCPSIVSFDAVAGVDNTLKMELVTSTPAPVKSAIHEDRIINFIDNEICILSSIHEKTIKINCYRSLENYDYIIPNVDTPEHYNYFF